MNVFYSASYAAAACEFDTTRKSAWIAGSLSDRPIPGVHIVAPAPATARGLEAVHAPDYVAAVRTGHPRALAESNGLSWDPGLWTAVTASTGGAVAAVLDAMRSRRNAGSLSSGLHHARAASGSGFCTFNGLALATRAALDAGARRVLILDLDAHCGGGTASLVGPWAEVVTLDVSVSYGDAYGRGLRGKGGSAAEHAKSAEHGPARSTLDIVTSPEDYQPTIERRLRALDDLAFDILIYNAGMDPHQASMGGLRGITFTMLAERERLVFDWARARRLPVAFTLAGGYLGNGLSQDDLVGLHRLTIASGAIAERGEPLDLQRIENLAYAGPHRGTEGFSFDANGRKTDAGFHEDLLGDEEEDPFAYDLDRFAELTPENQARFIDERDGYTGRHADFLEALLSEQRKSTS